MSKTVVPIPQLSEQDTNGVCTLLMTYRVWVPELKMWLVVLPGFQTDGASIPKWAWKIVGTPFDPEYIGAAFIHDAVMGAELASRPMCDGIFFHRCLNEHVPLWKSALFYSCVRAAGWTVWNKHTPETLAENRRFCSLQAA